MDEKQIESALLTAAMEGSLPFEEALELSRLSKIGLTVSTQIEDIATPWRNLHHGTPMIQ